MVDLVAEDEELDGAEPSLPAAADILELNLLEKKICLPPPNPWGTRL